jgi:hypothetical protein
MVTEMNTKLYLWIGFTLEAFAVFIVVGMILFNMSSGDRAYQEYYSKEIGLIEDAILTSDGNLVLSYNITERRDNFDVLITQDCEVRVSERGLTNPYISYYCFGNDFIDKGDDVFELNEFRLELKDKKNLVWGDFGGI